MKSHSFSGKRRAQCYCNLRSVIIQKRSSNYSNRTNQFAACVLEGFKAQDRRSIVALASFPDLAAINVMVPNETEKQQLSRAKGYPYLRPDTSFLFCAGDVFEFDNAEWRGLDNLSGIVGRCGSTAASFAASRGVDLPPLARADLYQPVLAIGSNAGPEQLRRKYPANSFPKAVIPVIQVELEGFDVVYTPYVSSYGSCTATLEPSPGTTVSIFITHLTEPLLERMHATEGGYDLCRLSQIKLRVAPLKPHSADSAHLVSGSVNGAGNGSANGAAGGSAGGGNGGDAEVAKNGRGGSETAAVPWVYQYNHKLGCIALPVRMGAEGAAGSSPVSIAEIPASGRSFPAIRQVEMLEALRQATEAAGSKKAPLEPVDLAALSATDLAEGSTAASCLDRWILANIHDGRARRALCGRLELHAKPFSSKHAEIVESL